MILGNITLNRDFLGFSLFSKMTGMAERGP